jgi:Gas vesicle synthesis protein GvpL/GvpF
VRLASPRTTNEQAEEGQPVRNGLRSTTRRERHGGRARSVFRRSAPDGSASEVVWVYAVTADLDADQICGLTGVAGEPVRVVSEADDAGPGGRPPGAPRIGAVVGSVDDAVFGEESLTSLLTDLTSVETVGRAHHKVIASTASAGPVVPLRLATTYPDDATIRALLAARRAELAEMLQDFR